jgi:hypothetical protein
MTCELVYLDFVDDVCRAERKERRRAHKDAQLAFLDMLRACTGITATSTWRKITKVGLLDEKDTRFLALEEKARIEAFTAYTSQLARETQMAKVEGGEDRKVQQRTEREAFRSLLEERGEELEDGTLSWKEALEVLGNDKRCTAIMQQTGVNITAKDLYEDHCEKLKKEKKKRKKSKKDKKEKKEKKSKKEKKYKKQKT